jgi:hypothetical protein
MLLSRITLRYDGGIFRDQTKFLPPGGDRQSAGSGIRLCDSRSLEAIGGAMVLLASGY